MKTLGNSAGGGANLDITTTKTEKSCSPECADNCKLLSEVGLFEDVSDGVHAELGEAGKNLCSKVREIRQEKQEDLSPDDIRIIQERTRVLKDRLLDSLEIHEDDNPNTVLKIMSSMMSHWIEDSMRIIENLDLANQDGLTGLSNRRSLVERGDGFMSRRNLPVSLIMLDVDNFKNINDTYGHGLGDEVIKSIADVMKSCGRGMDVKARYGGEEFVFVLNDSGIQGAIKVAEEMAQKIREIKVFTENNEEVSVTASFGVSERENKDNLILDLIGRADALMYEAKENGKDEIAFKNENGKVDFIKDKNSKREEELKQAFSLGALYQRFSVSLTNRLNSFTL